MLKDEMKIIKKIIVLCVFVSMATGIVACSGKKVSDGSSKVQVDMRAYFKLKEYTDGEDTYPEATEGEYAVVINGEIQNTRGICSDGKPYVDIEIVNDYINDGVYWDSFEQKCLYALPYEEINIRIGDKSYTADGKIVTFDKDIVVEQGGTVYVLLEYVKEFTAMEYNVFDDDYRRIIIDTRYGAAQYVTTLKNAKIRIDENIASDYLINLNKDTRVRYIEAGASEEWMKIETADGITGYVKVEDMSEVTAENVTTDFKEIEYPSISKDFDICLGWHQMEYAAGNNSFSTMVKNATCLNVISPTWFKLNSTSGGISSLASSTYVKSAHDKGMEVWPLISDFDMSDDGTYYVTEVLPYTSKRKLLVTNIMNEILECGADGINIDFERISYGIADDYIQFLRELSIECRKNRIVLSVDNYAPTAGTMYYNRKAQGQVADYVIIMGYDEHWSGSLAGSVASLPFVENGIKNTIAEVPAEKVINAIPFYTRIWVETPAELTDGSQTIIEDPIYGDYALSSKAVGLQTAINSLKNNGGSKVWLEALGQYYGEYKSDGSTYRIWIEDDESIELKLKLIDTYNIAGVAAWKLGLEYSGIWKLIDQYVD